jgi:hypothetical protein
MFTLFAYASKLARLRIAKARLEIIGARLKKLFNTLFYRHKNAVKNIRRL